MLENIADMAPNGHLRQVCLRWFAFMERSVDFWPFGGAVHLRPHWARVLVLASTIAAHEGFSDSDIEALAMAAAFHDTRRTNPMVEEGHGDRAAEHYSSFCEKSGMHFDPRAHIAIKWHDRDDMQGMDQAALWDAAHGDDPRWDAPCADILRAFKDSDGLDRMRLREEALDLSYLRFPYSKTLKPFAKELLRESTEEGARKPLDGKPAERRPYLVVVDVQEDTVSSYGEDAVEVADRISARASDFDGRVVFTKETGDPIMAGVTGNHPRCEACSDGWMLTGNMEALRRELGSSVYLKGLGGSLELAQDLEAACARGNLSSVSIVGVGASSSVLASAVMIRNQLPSGVDVSVDLDLIADASAESLQSAISVMSACGISISRR